MEAEKTPRYNADILVVDDTHDNLRLLSKLLIEHGYYVRPVSDGKRAISAIQDQLPDLVLLDIMMPGMDGYEVCRRLQADELTRDVPIVFISALNETFDKVKAFSSGGRDYISKPFQEEEVLARVRTHLALHFAKKSLEAEIIERKRVEETLRKYNRDLATLNRMGQSLQTCSAEMETYAVVTDMCSRLLPGSSGRLLIRGETDSELETAANWGNPPDVSRQHFETNLDFIHRDRDESVEHPDAGRISSRIGYSEQERALYIPVCSSGTILAVLIVFFKPNKSNGIENDWRREAESKQMLIEKMAENYALALVNLRLREMLRIESIRDPLTGLFNRRHMEAALERETCRAHRHGGAVSVLMFDIDHFKHFNDTYGHETGDAVLKEIGALLINTSRGEDVACRYGGEEFLLILADTALEDAAKRAENLLEQIRRLHVVHNRKTLSVTISIGVGACPPHGTNVQGLVKAADTALYQAKKNGRDRVVVCNQGDENAGNTVF